MTSHLALDPEIRPGELVVWLGEQERNVSLVTRWYIDAIHERRFISRRNHERLVYMPRQTTGMFVGWMQSSGGVVVHSAGPVIYVPAYGLYGTWRGWVRL